MLRRIISAAIAVICIASLHAQDSTYPPNKPSPPKIESQLVLLAESVVQTQWTHTLGLVNAPQGLGLLNPGQCIRVGVYATGDNRDAYLQKTKLSFRVKFASHEEVHTLGALSEFKQIKPEGGDFVAAALGAAGIKTPETMKTSLGVSSAHWCAPVDVADGPASVEAEVESPSGRQALKPLTIQIETFETGSKRLFKDIQELEAFSEKYYRQPNAARLLPVLQIVVAEQTEHPREGQVEIMSAFLSAAIKSDPIAARDFQVRIATQPPLTRALGLLALRSAGYDINEAVNALDKEQRQKFLELPDLQDPFDQTPTEALFQHLDMMWAVFEATGQFKPVKTIASALSWRTDYEDFKKLQNTPNHPTTLTPSLVRGVTYTAAGWSLWSFQRNDTLVADYIEFLRASSDTPDSVKSELSGLSANPAFKRAGGE
jgi:hypothetical protein